MGFNCIRLPFSLALVVENPIVPAHALAANPELVGMRALDAMDALMRELLAQNVLVVLNNHNSQAGWCCDVNSKEGLWNTDEYSTAVWADAMGAIVQRYRSFPNVVAIDIRNEIHDVGDKIITWGASQDTDTDWKAATELAASKVQAANPDILVIVSGLCFGSELRPLQADPPRLAVPNRLVFTTHTYGFSMWWSLIESISKLPWTTTRSLSVAMLVLGAAGLIALAVLPASRAALRGLGRRAVLLTLSSWFLGLGLILVTAGLLWLEANRQSGCGAMNGAPITTSAVAGCLAALAAIVLALLCAGKLAPAAPADVKSVVTESVAEQGDMGKRRSDDEHGIAPKRACCLPGCALLNLAVVAALLVVLGAPLFILARDAQLYDLQRYDHNLKWGTQHSVAPIWVGEFGTGDVADNLWWSSLLRYMRENNLSWAYWPFDGSRWENATGRWVDEGYGLLNDDWSTVRNRALLEGLQSVQPNFETLSP
jgi:hypothetical protein